MKSGTTFTDGTATLELRIEEQGRFTTARLMAPAELDGRDLEIGRVLSIGVRDPAKFNAWQESMKGTLDALMTEFLKATGVTKVEASGWHELATAPKEVN